LHATWPAQLTSHRRPNSPATTKLAHRRPAPRVDAETKASAESRPRSRGRHRALQLTRVSNKIRNCRRARERSP
jgi:hypothetical protein